MVCSSFRQQKLEKVMDQEGLADEEVSDPSQQRRSSLTVHETIRL